MDATRIAGIILAVVIVAFVLIFSRGQASHHSQFSNREISSSSAFPKPSTIEDSESSTDVHYADSSSSRDTGSS